MHGMTMKEGSCVLLQGKWVKEWQRCGAMCTKMKTCKAWTFKSGFCSWYGEKKAACHFVRTPLLDTVAGHCGCAEEDKKK